MLDEYRMVQGAVAMYEQLFKNLVESVSNASNTCRNASLYQDDGKNIWYLNGKADAYKEVANRILKERDITKNEFNTNVKLNNKLYSLIRGARINSLEKILPDDRVRCDRNMERLKRMLVSAFEEEMVKCFDLGARYHMLRNSDDGKTLSEDELFKRLMELGGISKDHLDKLNLINTPYDDKRD